MLFLLLALPDRVSYAQRSGDDRPRVGLVLAGGGARGASHVGVLKVLERERIPIDYIAGTSMGSIVGGLYATGMSADEIEQAMLAVDWDGVFNDKVNREDRSYRRKLDDRLWLFGMKPGFSEGNLKLPPGLVQGQKISLLLTSLTIPVADIDSFDDLPIPYRAIAADIQTGEKVALDSGSLARSIRASMAVPAILAPVEIDGRRLVDGGIASNLPVEVVRDMGADIVIAVDLGESLSEHELGESVLGVVDQLTALLVARNVDMERTLLTDSDVHITPDLGDIASGQFERVGEAIPTGVTAADRKLGELRRLSLSEADYAEHVAARDRPLVEYPTIEFVRFDNTTEVSDDFLMGRLQASMRGDPIVGQTFDRQRIQNAIDELYGLDIFARVEYQLVSEENQYGLLISAQEKTWGPNYVQFGAKWNSSMNGNGILSIAVSHLMTELNSWNAEWRNTLAVGEEPGFLSDYYQPLGKGADWFAGGHLLLQQFYVSNFDVGTNDVVEQLQIQRLGALMYGGVEFGHWGRGTFGYTRGGGERKVRIGDPTSPDEDFDLGELSAGLEVDTLDNLFFPKTGHSARAVYRYSDTSLGASENFEQVILGGSIVRSFDRNTFMLYGDYKATIEGVAPPERLFRAGGLFNLSGFEFNQLAGQNFAQVALLYRRDLVNLGPLEVSLGGTVEYGNVWEDRSDIFDDGLLGGSLFLGADTPVGPFYIGWGTSESSNGTFYVSLGAVRNDPVLQ
jgi:NTE family protein